MGNTLSEEEEKEFIREGFKLDSPDADKVVNYGTAAPNCQPKHTLTASADEDEDTAAAAASAAIVATASSAAGQEVALLTNGNSSSVKSTELVTTELQNMNGTSGGSGSGNNSASNSTHARTTSPTDSDRRKQQQQQQPPPAPKSNGSANSTTTNNSGSGGPINPKKLSYLQMAKLGYQELVNAIIRPPRADYKMEALGPPAFNFCGKRFTRTDFTLRTKRGYNLECSHWEPVERATDRIPVVIYMHGNSSARVEVIPQLSYLLSLGLAVFAFDFAGSGKSDGEYVSLGYYEREDLSCIVAHLRATNVVSTIALWGRSMGAATAIMFGDRDPSIACMILDSSFADLTQLCEEMVEKGREQGIVVPNFVVSVAIRMLQSSVKKQAGFNLKQISPLAHCDKCFIPALFVAGEHDDFIKKHHSEQLYERYAGDKNLIIVEGDHNSPRPKFMFDSASIFLQTCLQIPNHWALPVPVSMNLMCPPWFFDLYQQRAEKRRLLQQQQQAAAAGGSSTALASMTGFNHDEMGMTAERQRIIQASLFKMLGQADSTNSSNTSTTSTGMENSDKGDSRETRRKDSTGSTVASNSRSGSPTPTANTNSTNGSLP